MPVHSPSRQASLHFRGGSQSVSGPAWGSVVSKPPPPSQPLHFLPHRGQHQTDTGTQSLVPGPRPRAPGENISLDVPRKTPCASGSLAVPAGGVRTKGMLPNTAPRQGSGLEGRPLTESDRCVGLQHGVPSLRPQTGQADGANSARIQPGTWRHLHRTFPELGSDKSLPQHRQSLAKTPELCPGGSRAGTAFWGLRDILEVGVSLRLVVKKEKNTRPGLRASERPGDPQGSPHPVPPPIPIHLWLTQHLGGAVWGHSTRALPKCRNLTAARTPSPQLPVGARWPNRGT